MRYDLLVVGAGLYGATVANRLAERGARVLVIDRRGHIAGNSYTRKRLDIDVHVYGAHIFHTADETVWEFVNRFADFNNYINSPIADYRGEIYNLPFNMNTFNRLWPEVRTPDDAKAKIACQAHEAGVIGEPANLEEQALVMAGRDIYEKLIKGYTEKQWGRPCSELPAFILKRVPLRFVYDNNYFNDPHQGIPVCGYTEMTERMLESAGLTGDIDVRTETDYFDFVSLDENGLPVRGEDGSFMLRNGDSAAKLIYSGMIDSFFAQRLGALEYRSLRFETAEYPDKDNFQGNAVVNYTAAEMPYTRSIEHKHFVFGRQPGTVVTREYPLKWTPGEEPYYPVNDEANNLRFAEYLKLSQGLDGVTFGGRLGKYRYYNMDQVIGEALKDAEEFTA